MIFTLSLLLFTQIAKLLKFLNYSHIPLNFLLSSCTPRWLLFTSSLSCFAPTQPVTSHSLARGRAALDHGGLQLLNILQLVNISAMQLASELTEHFKCKVGNALQHWKAQKKFDEFNLECTLSYSNKFILPITLLDFSMFFSLTEQRKFPHKMLKFETQLYLMLPNSLCKLLQTARCAALFARHAIGIAVRLRITEETWNLIDSKYFVASAFCSTLIVQFPLTEQCFLLQLQFTCAKL